MPKTKLSHLKIRIRDLPLVPNVCNQALREVCRNEYASLAHVGVKPGDISLLHDHRRTYEWYYILSGRGRMWVGENEFPVCGNEMIIIDWRTDHQLACIGRRSLYHLVFSTPPFDPADVNLREERI
jgi:mannose-6-phosphate isomerase-like protein (cupin superfamily)